MKLNETLQVVDLTKPKWAILQTLWETQGYNTLSFSSESDGWHIKETLEGSQVFDLRRDFITLNRYTNQDTYGLLGVSLLNLESTSVIITEGVSDFISVKLNNPGFNVLGVTTLGGNPLSKSILISLFTDVLVVADSDKAGLVTGYKWKRFFDHYGVRSKLWQPSESKFKDYTDEFIFNLRLRYGS